VTRVIKKGGLPVTDSSDGSDYLGKLWIPAKDSAKHYPCIDVTTSDYATTFNKHATIYTLKVSEIQAKIEANVEGVLKQANVDDSPSLAAKIAVDVSNTIQSNNYNKFTYKVMTLKDETLDKLDTHAESTYDTCYKKIASDQNTFFIRSVAVITSDNKFSSISNTSVSASIDAEVKNVKIQGNAIDAMLAAKIGGSIKTKVDETINSEIASHSRVYGLGFSLPYDISNERYASCEEKYGCKYNNYFTKFLLMNDLTVR